MPPGVVTAPPSSSAGCFGPLMRPHFTDNSVISQGEIYQIISESFLTVKGAALFLPRGNGSSASSTSRFSQLRSKHAGDIQQHLQTMFTLLRPEDNIKLAVRLESVHAQITRYMSLHKACEVARCYNYFPGSLFLTWVSYYQSRVSSDQVRINEWNVMQDVQSHRADSPVLFSDVPTERELTERQIKTRLREIMMQKDLENVTCKEIRTELEMNMTCNLREFKEFIDNEMIVILGQMDSPTEIFEHVFLGSEWNASNLEELQSSGVQYILNVTREIDNFFPGVFEYHNIRVYDEEATDLLAYWNDTYKYISRAKKAGSKCLVHCKMGISRSAATVIAYAMKEYGWDLDKAFDYVKERRTVTKPNPSFMRQLEEYQGILAASKQRHNKLWRSHSDSDLSEHHEPLSKPCTQQLSLGHADSHNQAGSKPGPSVKELLESLGTSANTGKPATENQSIPPAVKPKQLSSSPEDVAAVIGGPEIPSLRAPPEDQMPLSLSNGLCESEEPAPKVVPELQEADTLTAAQGILVGQPYPPPCYEHLHLSPAPSQPQPDALSGSPPVVEPLLVSVPQPETTQSTQQAVAQCLSAPVPVGVPDCDQHAFGSLLNGLEAQPSSSSDAVGDPGAISQDGEELLNHSADHINFFSAREKFKGMSQDGKGCQQKSGGKEQEVLIIEGKVGEKKEQTAPVHVSALKPTVNTEASPLCPLSQSVPQGVHGPETLEEREVFSLKKTENTNEEGKTAEEEEEEATAGGFYSNWTRGSVRRATRQLEQKMKQEAPPLNVSPPSLSGGTSCSLQRPPSVHLTAVPSAPEASVCLQVSVVSSVQGGGGGWEYWGHQTGRWRCGSDERTRRSKQKHIKQTPAC
ncbi:hypothetical protein fugu_009328 [Takifugu bimaculatus]|uniref:protein-serine/threonine phosphatase n=1 Tax=Takifugu bimaculatus TaxID=433685 RepID=A0A4Z2B2P2_9TELE|nr:hypothetical protein fugu_009328 [Takifugu bimaculatus]